MQRLTLVSGNQRIVATVSTPARGDEAVPHPGIIFVHGLGSNRNGYIAYGERATAQLGVTCLALDLSGHGASTGELYNISPAQHLQDVITGYDELATHHGVIPEQI